MPFNAAATNKFSLNPANFLAENYVRTNGGGGITKTFVCVHGAAPANKFHGGAIGTVAYGTMVVNDSDLKTCTAISTRAVPTVYMGLFDQASHSYHAQIQDAQDATHPLLVYYLPAAANQLVRIQIPTGVGPNIILTEPLSGCTIFITDDGAGTSYVYHANGISVAPGGNDAARIYMRDLLRAFINGTAQAPTHMFDRPFYDNELTLFQQHWTNQKHNLGRALNTIAHVAQAGFNVFGVRAGGNWSFHFQMGDTVSSTRTGAKALFMGTDSNKFKVRLSAIPVVPVGGVPNP